MIEYLNVTHDTALYSKYCKVCAKKHFTFLHTAVKYVKISQTVITNDNSWKILI